MAACLLVFHRALQCWFVQDDFASLRWQVHSFSDIARLFTEPKAQGTIRPFSEDFFFAVFRRLFGLNALPYKVWVFLTQMANLALLWGVARRLLPSRPVAMLAPLVWGVNLALVAPLGWTSAYNQVLCSFIYLASFLLFLRHVETGRWSFYAAQWGTFLVGFGVLETIVAYPAVVLAYCALEARKHTWKAVPLLVPSAVYSGIHLWLIPRAATGPYVTHFDLRMVSGLGDYWTWVLGPVRFAAIAGFKEGTGLALVLALTAGLGVAWWRADGAGHRVALFGLAWFVITLGPVLPLPDHRLDYYLTVPAIGLGLTVAALASHVPRAAVVAWLAVYVACSVGYVRYGMRSIYERSQAARVLIEGVTEIRRLHPGQAILLTGVDERLFYAALYDRGPLAAGLQDVFLAPSGNAIRDQPGHLPVDAYRLPASVAAGALRGQEAVVYRIAGNRFRNITNAYRYVESRSLAVEPPRRVDVGLPYMAGQLGPGWFGIQQSHRWMGRRAEVRVAGPRTPGERLRVEAIYPEHLNLGPIKLAVAVNGVPVGEFTVHDRRSERQEFALPPALVGQQEITVRLETDRTFRPADDPRELGLAFGVIELVEPAGTPGGAMLN
jgi:hypothetical protein